MTEPRLANSVSVHMIELSDKLESRDASVLRTESGLTIHQWKLLCHVCEHPNCRLISLVDILKIPVGELVIAFDELKRIGLIEMSDDHMTLSPTDDGHLMYLTTFTKLFKSRGVVAENLSNDEQKQLIYLLRKVTTNLDEIAAGSEYGTTH